MAQDVTKTPRLFVDAPLAEGAGLEGTPAHAHYLGNVLRCALGAVVRLFNGQDGEFTATIDSLRKDRLRFAIGPRLRPQAPEPDIWLVFCALKRDATDLVAEKATELGVSGLVPVFSARTNAGRVNTERLRGIAVEAAEQSERLTVPSVHEPVPLFDLLGGWDPTRPLAAALERTNAPPLAPLAAGGQGALLIGPEGGFSPGELDVLTRAPFIQAVSLGPRVLRAETAAIAGLALMLARP